MEVESKVKCLYLMVLDEQLDINNFYRKWKSDYYSQKGPYFRSVRDRIRQLCNTKFVNTPITYVDIGEFIEDNIGFGR
jgi:uncharacterized protein YwgA